MLNEEFITPAKLILCFSLSLSLSVSIFLFLSLYLSKLK